MYVAERESARLMSTDWLEFFSRSLICDCRMSIAQITIIAHPRATYAV